MKKLTKNIKTKNIFLGYIIFCIIFSISMIIFLVFIISIIWNISEIITEISMKIINDVIK